MWVPALYMGKGLDPRVAVTECTGQDVCTDMLIDKDWEK